MTKVHDFDSYFDYYIGMSNPNGIDAGLREGLTSLREILPEMKRVGGDYAYEKEKWTVKEMLMHLIDSELIFNYRALRFARKDNTSLAGYDHDAYVKHYNAKDRSIEDLLEEFEAQRRFTIKLFQGFNPEMLAQVGEANNMKTSVEAIGKIIAGHQAHHLKILKERYF